MVFVLFQSSRSTILVGLLLLWSLVGHAGAFVNESPGGDSIFDFVSTQRNIVLPLCGDLMD